ncbi:RecF/RecN/SMC N terminal domain containing protein [Tritrichomonas foetus]|uniref:RecF/RecN/SMC N terminal domain containing protein n=1 Tax=Tritrichomonas foetus TaxID=1144522 RepID=A0A1J4J799_9EUKA|nr:RecF/RecN/SMC N terminal domain containing protein [Tritrichomonas foetus]|eukprot:OHS95024.1 RecF/RecN/SMC N terminal domain containing protein [Tritrichomonas foetus]
MSHSQYEAPAGTLLSIRMINFMKHDNLLIDLKPHANFITGRNGSGKSSILVALAVGLGSNTRLSGRGNNMADLIKDGRHEATIIITIKNTPSGYQQEKYGDTIVITRKITRASTRFEISNFPRSSATLVREELTRILQFFNIQIDNPCSIMHQDIAREFIGTSTPQKKYELFMRGTLLTRLSDDIAKISANIKNVEGQKDERLAEKKDLDAQFEKEKRLNDIVEEADDLLNRIHDLEDELVWSYYRVAATANEEAQSSLQEASDKLNAANEKLQEKQEEANRAKEESDNYKKLVNEEMQRLAAVKRQKDQLAGTLNKIRSELTNSKNQLKHKENQIQRTKTDLENKKADRATILRRKEKAAQQMMEKRRKYIADLEEKQSTLSTKLENAESKLAEITAQYQQIGSSADTFKSAVREATSQLNNISNKLKSLRNVYSGNNGNDSLTNRIKNHANRFSFLPIGPLSRYIKLVDAQWGVAIQHIVGKFLDYFIVNNYDDERLLRRIVGNTQNFSIAISDFTSERYNTAQVPPASGAKLIIDLINIQNDPITARYNGRNITVYTRDIITNILVDILNVDHIWCVEDEKIARDLAFGPKKYLTITKSGVQFKFQSGYDFRIGAKTSTCKIGVDESARIAHLEREETEAKRAKSIAEERLKSIDSQIRDLKKDKTTYERARTDYNNQLNKIRVQLNNPPDETDDFDAQINAIDTRIEKLENNIVEDTKLIPEIREKIQKLQEEKTEAIKKITDISSQLNETDTFKAESDRLFNAARQAEHALSREKKIADALRERCDKLRDFARKAKDEAESYLAKARQHSPESEDRYKDTARPPKSLANLLLEEKKKYEEAQKISGLDFAAIRASFNKTKSQVEKATKFLTELQEFLNKAEEALGNRQDKLQSIMHSVTRRAKVSFLNYQRQRRYVGKLHFRHDDKSIDIAVKSKADSNFTDVSNLSGGEKSYCLVSLLLSLWEVMECPFYCVDEFDVFMDDINRQAATTLLVKGAEVMENRQFIFITPLSLDHLKNDDNVTIFEVAKTNE